MKWQAAELIEIERMCQWCKFLTPSFLLAPSAAPTNVRITAVTSSSISMELEPPNCIDRNGIITGYSVQYRVEKGGNTDTRLSPGASATLSDLVSSTNYSIQVAAVNTVGIGPYRSPIFQITEGTYKIVCTTML